MKTQPKFTEEESMIVPGVLWYALHDERTHSLIAVEVARTTGFSVVEVQEAIRNAYNKLVA